MRTRLFALVIIILQGVLVTGFLSPISGLHKPPIVSGSKTTTGIFALGDNDESKPNIIKLDTRKVVYGSAFFGEWIYSYVASPGADGTLFPQQDLDLIANLLDPSFLASAPPGYALWDVLLFNSFIWLPLVWGSILTPTKRNLLPFLLVSASFGGIALYPYLAFSSQEEPSVAEPQNLGWSQNSSKKQSPAAAVPEKHFQDPFNQFFRFLDTNSGRAVIASLVGFTFYTYFQSPRNFPEDWYGFWELCDKSQFAGTSLLDALILGPLLLDPITRDAKRRGCLRSEQQGERDMLAFAVPVFGALAWVLTRPPLEEDK